jgi:DNA repair protein RecN (Recombination protein N)
VRSGADKGLVSAVFSSEGTEAWCEENGIDPEDGEIMLLRRITTDGKSTCRVNGAAVTASQLRSLGALLLDIHGQNDGRQLLDEARHRDYLDRFGAYSAELEKFRASYGAWRDTLREIDSLTMGELEKARLTDNLNSQIQELEKARLRPGEADELEARCQLMKNSEKLSQAVDEAFELLYGEDGSAIETASCAQSALERVSGISEKLSQVEKSVSEAVISLEDAAETLRDLREELDFSPEEYDRMLSRLSLIRRLEKKYGGDEAELVQSLDDCKARLNEIEFSDERLEQLRAELAQRQKSAQSAAAKLTKKRQEAALQLETRIVRELSELSMPSVRFKAELVPVDNGQGFDSHGAEEVRFLMSANAGEEPGRIAKIASGGELSRIMLAMKNVFAENDPVQAMVFDEIDTGVSGIAAQRVGEKLARLAGKRQVLCVTHLPQIAAMADAHFRIEKSERGGRTFTQITPLDEEGRAGELARLHGGDNITETTIQSAREQLAAAQSFKKEVR